MGNDRQDAKGKKKGTQGHRTTGKSGGSGYYRAGKQSRKPDSKGVRRSAENVVEVDTSVKLLDLDENEFFTVKLAGKKGSSSNPSIITTTHPLGKAIYKKRRGDTVSIELPNGSTRRIKIISIVGTR